MRDHILRRWMCHSTHLLLSLLILRAFNSSHALSTFRWASRAFHWRLALFLRVLRIISFVLLRSFGLATVLKITIILVDCFYFPRAVLACIFHIVILDLLLLEILNRLRIAVQLKLVNLQAIAIKIVLQIVDYWLLLIELVAKLVVINTVQIFVIIVWAFPSGANLIHFLMLVIEHITALVLSNQILGWLIFHEVAWLQLLGELTVQIHAHVKQVVLLLLVCKWVTCIQLLVRLNLLSSVTLGIAWLVFLTDHPDILQILLTLVLIIKHGQLLKSPEVTARVGRLSFLPLRRLFHFHGLLRIKILRLQFGRRLWLTVQARWCNLLLIVGINYMVVFIELQVSGLHLVAHAAFLELGKANVRRANVVNVLLRLAILVIPHSQIVIWKVLVHFYRNSIIKFN